VELALLKAQQQRARALFLDHVPTVNADNEYADEDRASDSGGGDDDSNDSD
jgi:hypothetical protein